jgi:Glycosyl transferase family 2
MARRGRQSNECAPMMQFARPAVSVVMPSLNQCTFLEAAVRSVMSQGIENLELVVMDGGSADGTLELLTELTAEFAGHLRWFSAPDDGPAQAIHGAILEARAPLIGWLNSDDLYTAGAVQRAVEHMARHPHQVMVYGHGEHVDAAGTLLAPYPTRPPDTPLAAFADGCFICQPTVFFRRDAYLASGGLDSTLRTAFDFELWLRLFKAHPGGIGFVDAVQAQTRLHAGAITLRLREKVALEGMEVLHRHLGSAPPHWLLTHLEELLAQHPFHTQPQALGQAWSALVQQARGWLPPDARVMLERRAQDDRRLALASAALGATVYADGWAGPALDVRLWQPAAPARAVVLECEHAAPGGGRLALNIVAPDGRVETVQVEGNGPFELVLDVPDRRPLSRSIFRVASAGGFVPAEHEPGATDRRRLAFRLLGLRLLPQAC